MYSEKMTEEYRKWIETQSDPLCGKDSKTVYADTMNNLDLSENTFTPFIPALQKASGASADSEGTSAKKDSMSSPESSDSEDLNTLPARCHIYKAGKETWSKSTLKGSIDWTNLKLVDVTVKKPVNGVPRTTLNFSQLVKKGSEVDKMVQRMMSQVESEIGHARLISKNKKRQVVDEEGECHKRKSYKNFRKS